MNHNKFFELEFSKKGRGFQEATVVHAADGSAKPGIFKSSCSTEQWINVSTHKEVGIFKEVKGHYVLQVLWN